MAATTPKKKFKLVTNPTQLKPAKPPRTKIIEVQEIDTDTGDPAQFMLYQVTAGEVAEQRRALKKFKANGTWEWDQRYNELEQLVILWTAMRDNHNNRLWAEAKDAVDALKQYPQSAILKLLQGYDEVNGPQDVEAVEGNSDGTPTDSSPSD